MEADGFNRVTYPILFNSPTFGKEYTNVRNEFVPPPSTHPTRDSRYPAYAAVADDARFVTDYRPQCSQNTPPGSHFTTKQRLIHHAESLIQLSRARQSEWSGAALPMANTVPPPAQIVHSTPFDNEIQASGARFGLGLERADAKAPQLFGTYQILPTRQEILNNKKRIALTNKYEGGRNSPRGAAVRYND